MPTRPFNHFSDSIFTVNPFELNNFNIDKILLTEKIHKIDEDILSLYPIKIKSNFGVIEIRSYVLSACTVIQLFRPDWHIKS